MAALADPEIRKAFTELQKKKEEIMNIQRQLILNERKSKKASINKSLIEEFSSDSKMYKSVGRMFLLTTHAKIVNGLDQEVKDWWRSRISGT